MVLVAVRVGGNSDVWTFDLVRNAWARLTSAVEPEGQAIWDPDARRIGFFSSRSGNASLFVKGPALAAEERAVLMTPRIKKLEAWSPDGRYVAYSSPREGTGVQEIWLTAAAGEASPRPLVQNAFNNKNVQFSPDGRWIAYEADDSGRSEVYAQPFPGPGDRVTVSTTGGAQVRWRRDGTEIFYVGLDDRLFSVPATMSSDGRTLSVGPATPLFSTRIPGGAVQSGGNRQQYAVTPDGQRFLINSAAEESVLPITLILNWNPATRTR